MTNSAYIARPRKGESAPPPVTVELDPRAVARQVGKATRLLKSLANQHRLMILCHLVEGEQTVGALEAALGIQQAHLSQQLAQLRAAGLVRARRESRNVHYSLGSAEAAAVLSLLYRLFCPAPLSSIDAALHNEKDA